MAIAAITQEAVLGILKAATAAFLVSGALAAVPAHAVADALDERDVTGVRVQIDNDFFAEGGKRDRDYTGGMAVTLSGRAAADGFLSLDPILKRLDKLVTPDVEQSAVFHARQLGLMAFTPGDILAEQPLPNDRPYASLLFVSNGRVRVAADNRTAWSSSLTLGMLGLSLSEDLHKGVHQLTGSDPPRGYEYQISAGGEPTARYTVARHHLWIANPSATIDVKTTVQGSVGYLTETSAAISMRAGRFSTAWWSFAPELTDYIAAPLPVDPQRHSRTELYFFSGVRVKARAYNAFLQGQFRDSAVHYSANELEPIIAEAWAGVVTQLQEQTQLSYTINYQTAEVRHGTAASGSLWGALQFSHNFQ
jgi:hypothetical protein